MTTGSFAVVQEDPHPSRWQQVPSPAKWSVATLLALATTAFGAVNVYRSCSSDFVSAPVYEAEKKTTEEIHKRQDAEMRTLTAKVDVLLERSAPPPAPAPVRPRRGK